MFGQLLEVTRLLLSKSSASESGIEKATRSGSATSSILTANISCDVYGDAAARFCQGKIIRRNQSTSSLPPMSGFLIFGILGESSSRRAILLRRGVSLILNVIDDALVMNAGT